MDVALDRADDVAADGLGAISAIRAAGSPGALQARGDQHLRDEEVALLGPAADLFEDGMRALNRIFMGAPAPLPSGSSPRARDR
jgi:hypothetical protein